jgi:hypothetical protein
VILVLVGARILRGRSDSLRRVGLLTFLTLGTVPLASYTALVHINSALDESPVMEHTTKILRAWTTKPKNTKYYHIEIASWRAGEATITLDVSSTFASRATVGRTLTVRSHAGRFGWEWIDTFQLVDN